VREKQDFSDGDPEEVAATELPICLGWSRHQRPPEDAPTYCHPQALSMPTCVRLRTPPHRPSLRLRINRGPASPNSAEAGAEDGENIISMISYLVLRRP
jgi:hypothetical protein